VNIDENSNYLSVKNDVILFDTYDKLVNKINEDGILVIENDGSEKQYFPKAYLSGTEVGSVDLLIMFVKNSVTKEALKSNLTLVGPETVVMTLQNGAGNNKDIAEYVNKNKIIVGTTAHNSVSKELATVYHSGVGPSYIGPNVKNEEMLEKLQTVKETFNESGLNMDIINDIQKVLWKKIFVNCAINGLSMVMNCKIGLIYDNKYLWDIALNIIDECIMISEVDGSHFDRDEIIASVKEVIKVNETGLASMCQDRRNLRKTEIDRINGAIVNIGLENNIATPYNTMLVKMVHAVEDSYLENK